MNGLIKFEVISATEYDRMCNGDILAIFFGMYIWIWMVFSNLASWEIPDRITLQQTKAVMEKGLWWLS